jgi:hypothetical protein
MVELRVALDALEKDDSVGFADTLPSQHPRVSHIQQLAEKYLITDGKCNFEMMDYLTKQGYYVFPLQWDEFGWIVGAISTIKGIITYG